MKRILAVAAAVTGLLVSTGYAAAATAPAGPAEQALGQAAGSGQTAGALSGASQSQPANQNISVRVLSPGDNGDVTQTNSVNSSATAANANLTGQSADQTQSGSCGCEGGTQAIGQEADSSQAAKALSVAKQDGASNTNIGVRVLNWGDDGSVNQTNSVDSDATAANLNATGQDADQASGGSGTQAIGQEASNDQEAAAASAAEQSGAENTNISVRVLSPGDNGSVRQSNTVDSSATAANLNLLEQDADQDQGGSGGTQAIGQEAKSDQDAAALSVAKQYGASNTNIPVRVLSKGDDGRVSQSNSVDSSATAANLNATKQDADQDQGGKGRECGCDGGGIQAIGQEAKSDQDATALSAALQSGASNTNTPVRVGSKGDDGSVSQSNSVESDATALNVNLTKQDADQDQGGSKDHCCSADGIQAIGQEAKSDQDATAASLAVQSFGHDKCGCPSGGNTNTPVRVDSKGDGGHVTQSNSVDSDATAANLNALKQDADQDQSGGGGIQAIGQEAKNEQEAGALSFALQHGASNTNTPVRVDSKGDDGRVTQSNSVDSDATAANLNLTKQDADQDQGGKGKGKGKDCGCDGGGIQAIGQEAKNEQSAGALSAALQFGASNDNAPVRVDSKGDDGDVSQSNSVDSDATALNVNLTKQDADQDQWGSKECGCHSGTGIQAIGQEAKNEQEAGALSFALQQGASNSNTPVRVDSWGGGGDVEQSNSVDSDATAANLNALSQDADQDQAAGGGIAIQAIGQSAKSEQGALALSAALQFGASNDNAPVRVDSGGRSGDVTQSNSVDSDATALNINLTKQDADQDQWGRKDCGCHGTGIQAIGQEAKNEQGAFAGSLAVQAFKRGKCGCPSGGNSNTPVGVGSYGSGGSVSQSNSVDSDATALNLNALFQDADQDQGAGGIQAIGQSAKNTQYAIGLSAALQLGGANNNGRWFAD